MGAEIVVDNLDDMCNLMCNNVVPKSEFTSCKQCKNDGKSACKHCNHCADSTGTMDRFERK